MSEKNRRVLAFVVLFLLALLPGLSSGTGKSHAGPLVPEPLGESRSADLFLPAPRIPEGDHLSRPEVISGRYVTINRAALESADGLPAPLLHLNLNSQYTWLAVNRRIESNPGGSITWIGELDRVPGSSVFLVLRDDVVIGKVAMPGAVYTIYYVSDGIHTVTQVSPRMVDPENYQDTLLPPDDYTTRTPYEAGNRAPQVASDDGSLLDLLVVYTTAARVAAGGTAAIESLIELGVAETNRAYAQSGVTPRLFLVHMAEVVYTESGSALTDLERLTNPSDSFMDNVHALRNEYHADFVKLITETGGAGIAWLQQTIAPSFHEYAFSVTNRAAISPNYTFAHELGHNMGLRHDWYVDDETTPYSYAHGYTNRTAGWRTIMSYNNYCQVAPGAGCQRLLYFSNHANLYNGAPMGIAPDTKSDCVAGNTTPNPESCDASAFQVINAGAANNAGFRTSSKVWVGNSTDWDTATNWSDGRVPRFMDDLFIPTTPSGGSFPITGGTAHVRNLTIQNGANVTMSGGTLNVYGYWDEQGSGVFHGTGGTVILRGNLPQTITQNPASTFHHLEIGNGLSATVASPGSDIAIGGDITIKTGATLHGSDQEIKVGGGWGEAHPVAFSADTSTVIFNGTTPRVADKTIAATLINENFNVHTTCCGWGGPYPPPAGWSRQTVNGDGWLLGQLAGSGKAARWSSSTDGWLFTQPLSLSPGIDYTLSYVHQAYDQPPWETVQNQTWEVRIGTTAGSGGMTTLLDSVTSNSTTAATRTVPFTVPASGIYYLGFRATAPVAEDIALLDDITLSGEGALSFYNLHVAGSESVTLEKKTAITNDLVTHPGGTLHLNGPLSVEGSVTNNGTLRQTLPVPATPTTTHFLHIQNAAGTTTKYRGVEITPTGSGLGNTAVEILGHQNCSSKQPVTGATILRCFDITPASPQPATIRFYYLASEENNLTLNTLKIFRWGGTDWVSVGGIPTHGNQADNPRSFVVPDINAYSPFAAAPAAPNAIDLASFTATALENGDVLVEWETAAEWDHAGFNVYRSSSETAPGTAVNTELIAAQGMQGQGAFYELLDAAGLAAGIWYYTLEDVDIHGVATRHGPIAVTAGTPLAVALQQSGTGTAAAPLVALLLLIVLAAATVALRRRPSA